jgi:hypothetical protein
MIEKARARRKRHYTKPQLCRRKKLVEVVQGFEPRVTGRK